MRPLLYDQQFYETNRENSGRSAAVVVPLVLDLIKVKSVCDVGCGIGAWLKAFNAHGVSDVLGVDGDYVESSKLEIDPVLFRALDLREPFELGRTFDLAVSLEVAEHLPEWSADTFVESLAKLAPFVLFSAAIPYQGGVGHINEQWQDYWAGKFAEHGFRPVDCIRPTIWEDKRVCWWFRQNIILYCKETAIGEIRHTVPEDFKGPIRIVHPDAYLVHAGRPVDLLKDTYFSAALKALPALATRAISRRVRLSHVGTRRSGSS